MAVADLAGAPPVDLPSAAAPQSPRRPGPSLRRRVIDFLPRGNLLDDAVWRKRHNILQWLLLLHLPALTLFGFFMKHPPLTILITVAPIAVFRILGGLPVGRRVASFFTTAGIVYCSAALVALANGAIEAHFHFFIIVGFIALYQDWVPFGWNIAFTVLSHGVGSTFRPNLMFDHLGGMEHPWTWSLIHGVAVLAACVGMVLFWRTNEDEQRKALALTQELGEAEVNRRRFTSELLVNLARRNQSLLYRQLDIINQLEHAERDPDALADLFRLDHLATRIRRNAENLLVLSGEEPPRVWGKPVPLTDVVRAAIAETEDLSRVSFVVDERLSLLGHAVIDLTHLLAELIENAVRSSPPDSQVTVRTTPDIRSPGTVMLTVEDWGVGMPPEQLAAANDVLATPRDVDELVSNRLGLHVIARLAHRYSIQVVLTTTSGSGITAVVLLPPDLFTSSDRPRPGPMSGPFVTPAGAAFAGALEPGPLPQRTPRYNGTPNGTVNPPPNITVNGMITSSFTGTTAPSFTGPTNPTGPAGPHGRANEDDSTQPRRTTGLSGLPLVTPPTPAPGVRIPRTGPDWDGWWEPEAEPGHEPDPGQRDDGQRDTWPRDIGPRGAGQREAGQRDREQSDAGRRDSGPQPIVHGVTFTVSDTHASPATPEPPLRLSRRVPQSHLAPELQRDRQAADRQQAAAEPAAPPPDAARAREALSRYQASRRAAIADNDTSERNGS
jgi:signal transduction histidine kinase